MPSASFDIADVAGSSRFPVIAGFRVSWDSRKKPGQRVLGVWLKKEKQNAEGGYEEEAIERSANGRKYVLLTREYMAQVVTFTFYINCTKCSPIRVTMGNSPLRLL